MRRTLEKISLTWPLLSSVSFPIVRTLTQFGLVMLSATWNLLWFFGSITDTFQPWTSGWEGKSCPMPFLKIPNVCYLFSLIPPCGLPSISKDLRAKKNLSKHLVQLSYTWWNGGPERSNVGQQSQHNKKKLMLFNSQSLLASWSQ